MKLLPSLQRRLIPPIGELTAITCSRTCTKSFDKARDAVKKLSEVAKDPPYDALLRGSITALVGANRKLAQIAIVDAVSQNGKEKEIADANKELGKGDEYRDAGKFGDAVDHYRKAWEHALKA